MNRQERLLSQTAKGNLIGGELPISVMKAILVAQADTVELARVSLGQAQATLAEEQAKLTRYNKSIPQEVWIAMSDNEKAVVLRNLPADLSANDY